MDEVYSEQSKLDPFEEAQLDTDHPIPLTIELVKEMIVRITKQTGTMPEYAHCGPGTVVVLFHELQVNSRFINTRKILDCEIVTDPWYREGIMTFWPHGRAIENLKFVSL